MESIRKILLPLVVAMGLTGTPTEADAGTSHYSFPTFTSHSTTESRSVNVTGIGLATVTVTIQGNFGTVGQSPPDGITVSINGGPVCQSQVRPPNPAPATNVCTATILFIVLNNVVTIDMAIPSGATGWTVTVDDIKVVI